MFPEADCLLIIKTDLAPYLEIDRDRIIHDVKQMNSHVTIIYLSAKKGLHQWFKWMTNMVRQNKTNQLVGL